MYANQLSDTVSERRVGKGLGAKAIDCRSCGLHGLCRIAGLDEQDQTLIDRVVTRRKEVAAGRKLLRAGQKLDAVIAVRSGAFKVSTRLKGAEEQIVGFVLPGELLGLEALGGARYPYDVEALEGSSICRFSLAQLHLLESRLDDVQQQLILAMGRQARIGQTVPLLLGAKNADQRIALFLLGLSSRLMEHGFSGRQFRLPMSRYCIASYLGLAMETVSRVFKRLHAGGVLNVRARQIEMVDMQQLRMIAGLQY